MSNLVVMMNLKKLTSRGSYTRCYKAPGKAETLCGHSLARGNSWAMALLPIVNCLRCRLLALKRGLLCQ